MLKADRTFAIYLSFNGNCREAFNFYQLCFGGELHIQTMADTEHAGLNWSLIPDVVINATLRNDFFDMMGTDLTADAKINSGNRVSILIECSAHERVRFINKLLGRNYCSIKDLRPFIHIADMYGVQWILHVK